MDGALESHPLCSASSRSRRPSFQAGGDCPGGALGGDGDRVAAAGPVLRKVPVADCGGHALGQACGLNDLGHGHGCPMLRASAAARRCTIRAHHRLEWTRAISATACQGLFQPRILVGTTLPRTIGWRDPACVRCIGVCVRSAAGRQSGVVGMNHRCRVGNHQVVSSFLPGGCAKIACCVCSARARASASTSMYMSMWPHGFVQTLTQYQVPSSHRPGAETGHAQAVRTADVTGRALQRISRISSLLLGTMKALVPVRPSVVAEEWGLENAPACWSSVPRPALWSSAVVASRGPGRRACCVHAQRACKSGEQGVCGSAVSGRGGRRSLAAPGRERRGCSVGEWWMGGPGCIDARSPATLAL
jgi:hypothetical protein